MSFTNEQLQLLYFMVIKLPCEDIQKLTVVQNFLRAIRESVVKFEDEKNEIVENIQKTEATIQNVGNVEYKEEGQNKLKKKQKETLKKLEKVRGEQIEAIEELLNKEVEVEIKDEVKKSTHDLIIAFVGIFWGEIVLEDKPNKILGKLANFAQRELFFAAIERLEK